MSYTVKNIREAKDVAAEHGIGDGFSARFPREELGCEEVAFGLQSLAPGAGMPFAHNHERAEEVYLVLAGSGRITLDGDEVDIGTMDAVRIAPGVVRALQAGPDGLEWLAFGRRHEGDAQVHPVPWQ